MVAGHRPAGEDDGRGSRVDRPRGVGPVGRRPDRAGERQRPRWLVDDDERQRPGRGRRRTGQRLGAGAVDQEGRRPDGRGRRLADRALGGQRAGPVDRARGQRRRPADGQGRPGGDGCRRPQVDGVERVRTRDGAAGEDDGRGPRIEGPRRIRPVGRGPDRSREGQGPRGLVDDDEGQEAGCRRGGTRERLAAAAVDQQGPRSAIEGRGLVDRTRRGQRPRADRAVGEGQGTGDRQGVAREDRVDVGVVEDDVASGSGCRRSSASPRRRRWTRPGRPIPRCTSSCGSSGACRPGSGCRMAC